MSTSRPVNTLPTNSKALPARGLSTATTKNPEISLSIYSVMIGTNCLQVCCPRKFSRYHPMNLKVQLAPVMLLQLVLYMESIRSGNFPSVYVMPLLLQPFPLAVLPQQVQCVKKSIFLTTWKPDLLCNTL